ncbi:hypothetical protein [Streptomyces sp. NPDC059552]|uniref:hypothetical protein n=1 Tax=Streptomyces sp. NPDC059552 TaxID=3346862 RepID=UPI003687BD2E
MIIRKKSIQLERGFFGIVFKFTRLTMSPEGKTYALTFDTHSHCNHIDRDQAKERLNSEKHDFILAPVPLAARHGALALGFIGTTLGPLVPLIIKIFVGTP